MIRSTREGVVPRGVAVLLLAAALGLGALVQVALAGHYHTEGYCGSPNGFVHGASTTDGAFRARVEQGGCPPTYHRCTTFDIRNGNVLANETKYSGTCDAFYNSGVAEWNGAADVYYEVVFNAHIHGNH